MGWEFQCASEGVNEPTKDNFAGGPGGISCPQLLDGDWLFPDVRIILCIIGAEDQVIEVEKDPSEMVQSGSFTLGQQDLVVHINISIGQGALALPVAVAGKWRKLHSCWGVPSREWRWSWNSVDGSVIRGVSRCGGQGFQMMPGRVPVFHVGVGQVHHGFSGTTEERRALPVSHGKD